MTTYLPLDLKTTHNQSVNEGYKIVLERFMGMQQFKLLICFQCMIVGSW